MKMTRTALALSTLCALGLTLFDATTAPAEARQCVWNKAGFVIGVLWYRPQDLRRNIDDGTGTLYVPKGTQPVQRDVFPTAQGKCQRTDDQLVAALYCSGCKWVNKGMAAIAAALAAIPTAVICGASAGTACAAAATGAGMAIKKGAEMLPDPKQINNAEEGVFAVIVPPTDRWVDVWGTVWDMQVAPGGTKWFDNNDKPTCNPCYKK